MSNPADFLVEIIQSPPKLVSGIQFQEQEIGLFELEFGVVVPAPAVPVDLTDRLQRDALGQINRAVERDLLSFKTGDVTVLLDNSDGFLDDLFAHFGPEDRWQLRIARRGQDQFRGVVLGLGSVRFDRLTRDCEITAYGATRQLADANAELARRPRGVRELDANASAGATTLTLDFTTHLQQDDILHLVQIGQTLNEDVTVKSVDSSTQVSLKAGTQNAYSAGDPVAPKTLFHRFKTIDFLVRRLFKAAQIPVAEVRLSRSQFSRLGPSPLAHGGLGTAKSLISPGCERNGRVYSILDTLGSYYQPVGSPDADWVQEDATLQPWVDWSIYRKQSEGAPSIILRLPDLLSSANSATPWTVGFDDRGATKRIYRGQASGVDTVVRLYDNTSTDGTTWTGWVQIATISPGWASGTIIHGGATFDPVRNQVYLMAFSTTGNRGSFMYDVGLAAWTTLKNVSGSTPFYNAMHYIPEEDYVLAILSTINADSSEFVKKIVALRNGQELWSRPFPTSNLGTKPTGVTAGIPTPRATQNARWVNGVIYLTVMADNAVQLVWSSDHFASYTMRKIVSGTYEALALPSRIDGNLYLWPNSAAASADRAYHIAAPFFAGVVAYADFTGKGVSEALKDLATLANAVFWVDDDLQGHFVARDLYEPSQVLDVSDRLMERTDDVLWDQAVLFVEISGGGFSAVAGKKEFAAGGLSLTSPFITNEALAQALADSYYDFFGKRRAFVETLLRDPDGEIYQPLDRVTLDDGLRYLVYESNHDLAGDEVAVRFLEDV